MAARLNLSLTLLTLSALVPAASFAQAIVSTAVQENDVSRLVETRSTKPKITKCDKSSMRDQCFRVMLEMTPVDPAPVGIAPKHRTASAYSSTGSLCNGYPVSGVGRFDAYDSLRDKWNLDRLTYAIKTKPLIAVFDFECDGAISEIDQITIQLSFDFYVNARTSGQARYVFRGLEISR